MCVAVSWAFVDVSAFEGQTATITVNNLAVGSTGLSSIVQSNGIVGATNLYSESLRPQIHYSCRHGWLNDANGMVYYQGQYHLYYQHDPFNWAGAAQKFWGHAVSTDMVHWQELPEAIYPDVYGDWVWSGSAVIDSANTGGFQTGTNAVIVAPFTARHAVNASIIAPMAGSHLRTMPVIPWSMSRGAIRTCCGMRHQIIG